MVTMFVTIINFKTRWETSEEIIQILLSFIILNWNYAMEMAEEVC